MSGSGPFAVIGHVHKTHGLKGEVSVTPVAGASLSSLLGLPIWFVPPSATIRSARITGVRNGPKGELVSFADVSTIQDASTLTDRDMLANVADLPAEWLQAIEEGEDEIGFTVTDSVRGSLGTVQEIIETGANDVWVIDGPFGEVLVPVIDDVVTDIDYDSRSIEVTLLPGLLREQGESE